MYDFENKLRVQYPSQYPSSIPPYLSLLVTIKFVSCVCESVSVLYISAFVLLFLDSTCKWYSMFAFD